MDITQPFSEKLTHYTLIFHSFVFMQIFNEINARKLGEFEYNVFHGFFNNFLFIWIVIATCLIQYLMVEYGGASVRTCPLTLENHLICLGIGMFSLIQGVIVKKVLPVRWFQWIKIKDEPMAPEEAEKSALAIVRKPTFRKSHTKSLSKINDSGIERQVTRTRIN
jgi:P-type Ca2+ transporter type 2B